MVAMKLRWRAYPLPLDGCPRRTAAISSKEAHVTSHSITSTLLLSMLTKLQTSPACLPYGERACRRTAMLFSSPESSTLRGTSSWWRDFDKATAGAIAMVSDGYTRPENSRLAQLTHRQLA